MLGRKKKEQPVSLVDKCWGKLAYVTGRVTTLENKAANNFNDICRLSDTLTDRLDAMEARLSKMEDADCKGVSQKASVHKPTVVARWLGLSATDATRLKHAVQTMRCHSTGNDRWRSAAQSLLAVADPRAKDAGVRAWFDGPAEKQANPDIYDGEWHCVTRRRTGGLFWARWTRPHPGSMAIGRAEDGVQSGDKVWEVIPRAGLSRNVTYYTDRAFQEDFELMKEPAHAGA